MIITFEKRIWKVGEWKRVRGEEGDNNQVFFNLDDTNNHIGH